MPRAQLAAVQPLRPAVPAVLPAVLPAAAAVPPAAAAAGYPAAPCPDLSTESRAWTAGPHTPADTEDC